MGKGSSYDWRDQLKGSANPRAHADAREHDLKRGIHPITGKALTHEQAKSFASDGSKGAQRFLDKSAHADAKSGMSRATNPHDSENRREAADNIKTGRADATDYATVGKAVPKEVWDKTSPENRAAAESHPNFAGREDHSAAKSGAAQATGHSTKGPNQNNLSALHDRADNATGHGGGDEYNRDDLGRFAPK